jgi:hypothetical protein
MADFKKNPSVNGVDVSLVTHSHVSGNITDATNANTANTLVKRDASGNFSAGTITAALNGNASSATTAAACTGNAATTSNASLLNGIGSANFTRLDLSANNYTYNGFHYEYHATPHLAVVKKTGSYSYYWRRNDTGLPGGANETTIMELFDNGHLVVGWCTANTFNGALNGNAATATKLSTARTVALSGDVTGSATFDGSANATITTVVGDDSHAHSISTVSGLQGVLDSKLPASHRGVANGVASLDASGLVPAAQLPSYVDDVLEYANFAGLPVTGITGKIYVALDTSKIYRWSGSSYIEISPTAGTADSATKLVTARTINGVAFDGTAAITVADSTKLPLAGGTLTGALTVPSGLVVLAQGGGEGGELFLQKGPSDATTTNGLILDLVNGIFRVFENGGAYRGAILNIAECGVQSIFLHSTNYNQYTVPKTGGTFTGDINLSGVAPTIHLIDSDHRSAHLHTNANLFYILGGPAGSSSWDGVTPFYLNLINGDAVFGGNVHATSFIGSGASLTALNAAQLTTGVLPSARLVGEYLNLTKIGFGASLGQFINLFSTDYGVGIQANTLYNRGINFAWYKGGVHSDTQWDPGLNGTRLMSLDGGGNLALTGGDCTINSAAPTMWFQDSNGQSCAWHCNDSMLYLVRAGNNSRTMALNSRGDWPLQINLDNNNTKISGELLVQYPDTTGIVSGQIKINNSNEAAGNWASLSFRSASPETTKRLIMYYGETNSLRFGRYNKDTNAWEANPFTFGMDTGEFTTSGAISVAPNAVSSYIYMGDVDHGGRTIHCNENYIGFLKQDTSWGACCNDEGDWLISRYCNALNFKSLCDLTNTAAANYVYDTGDGYFRKKSLANVKNEIVSGDIAGRPTWTAGQTTRFEDSGGCEVRAANSTSSAHIAFHVPGVYASYFGLDCDGSFKVGGWSMGAVRHAIWHAGNDGTGSGLDADLLDGLQSATANTASTIVARDASGNFSAGTITATLNGNASSATTASTVSTMGQVTQPSTRISNGVTMQQVYSNGYPVSYGNVLSLGGAGQGQLLIGWSGTTGAVENNYIRSLRDSGTTWSPWSLILTDSNYNSYAPTKTGGGASGTWGINITGNAATASNASLLNGAVASVSHSVNTIVQRHSAGYVYANYFNTTADVTDIAPSHIAMQYNTDGFIRWQTPAQFKTHLALNNVVNVNQTVASNITSGTLPDSVLPARLGIGSQTVTNWNDAVYNGFFMAVNALNAPTASIWYLGMAICHNTGWVTQTVHAFTEDNPSNTNTWRRELNGGGVWTAWYRLRSSEAELDARYVQHGSMDLGVM